MLGTILLDYGHCLRGSDTGTGGYGLREENCTRDIGTRLKAKLENHGYKVVVISCDEAVSVRASLNFRVNNANSYISRYGNVVACISLHLNSGGGRGAEIYTKNGSIYELASNILKSLEAEGFISPYYGSRGIKNGSDLALVGSISHPKAMLVESNFMDSEDMLIYDSEKIANAIFRGITGSNSNVAPPTENKPVPPTNNSKVGKYLNLDSNEPRWRVYKVTASPTVGNECGTLAPKQFGGLSYKIEKDFGSDIFQITTQSFGIVKIVGCIGDGGSITVKPIYGGSVEVPSNKKYLNLKPYVQSWRVYSLNAKPVIGNECGTLSPSTYGGLTYEILEDKGDIKIINTQSFGKVQIYAPNSDTDCTITNAPLY